MQYGFIIPRGNVHEILELTQEAEEAGWDGVFYWDGINIEVVGEMYDPWAVLAAMAVRTNRVRIGAMLTPPSRRRPWKLARETVTVDHLSHGRLVVPVGLGALDDGGFGKVGEVTERKERAQLMDESLDILTGLWSGQPFSYHGQHYQLEEMTFLPPPAQQPRIPIWVVGAWPAQKSMQRVLKYDGLLPTAAAPGEHGNLKPDDIRAMRAYIEQNRTSTTPFDIIWEGETPGDNRAQAAEIVKPYIDSGITWWMESRWLTPDLDVIRTRIRQGPPRIV
ncbi:luciferase-like protein [Dictyobacter vulcani]|uniref:Luciferase-like protein n=1 Tax=Dictyobacter vulcani TaxID=2607529 RepID=A0A5J4KNP2_9CHLR|nr:LLM class flavin-dependent oxidoreductase [Dictyobacter vulcani]GER91358.1 luciferase-like protein [Dictyobacter vulcani]